ncbi:MAG: peptide ABC transporter substrate-binding protein [Deltaproteobacteria bacterium]|nr:peptide ABC transporter substrate-binding protein [Deltaproteobacteria bacterium]
MRFTLRLALCALLVSVLGCQRPSKVEPVPGDKAVGPSFVFAQGDEPRTLDPGLITDTYGSFFAQNLFEGLLVWDAAGQTTKPGAAERFEVSPDGRTWTFHMRRDAIWSNGDAVTATDFLVAWRRVLNPEFGSDYASLLYPIKGARALAEGDVVDAQTLGVEVRDRFTLVVTLEAPTPWFDAIVAHHVSSPVNSAALKRHGYAWWQPGRIVVNGPFQLHEWTPGKSIILRKNPYFHGAETVKLFEVVAKIVTDPAEVVRQYEAGEIHWTGNAGLLPAGRLAELAERPDARSSAELGTAWMWLNTDEGPLADPRVRRALSLAVDRTNLAQALGPGDLVTARMVPPGMPGYSAAEVATTDVEMARKLMAEAGFPGGEGFPAVELAIDARPVHQRLGETLAAQWREALGVEVTPYVRQYGAHAEAVRTGGYQVGRGGWLGDYPDPSSFLELLETDNALNSANWSDTGFDGLVAEARRTEDASSRLRLLSQAERLVLEQAPIIPLYHFGSLSLLKPYVQGFVDNPMQVHLLRYLELKAKGPSMGAG